MKPEAHRVSDRRAYGDPISSGSVSSGVGDCDKYHGSILRWSCNILSYPYLLGVHRAAQPKAGVV
ncbi:unnamed protein product [Penicillium pancosmium]